MCEAKRRALAFACLIWEVPAAKAAQPRSRQRRRSAASLSAWSAHVLSACSLARCTSRVMLRRSVVRWLVRSWAWL